MKFNYLYLLVFFFFLSCVKYKTADLVVHNARIYTVNEKFEVAQAMAIKDGKIIAIGKEREIMNKYQTNQLIDAKTKPIFPGFMDGHCHFMGSGLNSFSVNLSKAKSIEECVKLLQKSKEKIKELKWITGFGWDENKWEDSELTNNLLNSEFPSVPVLIWRVDGHSIMVNNKAIEVVAPDFEVKNGIVKEKQMGVFTQSITYTDAQKKNGLRYAEKNFFKYGITSVSDAGLSKLEVDLLVKMYESNILNIRINAMLFPSESTLAMKPIFTEKLKVNSYKMMLDGSVGSTTACFKTPYKSSQNNGELSMSIDEFRAMAQLIYEKGWQLNVHCIGDSAVKVVLTEMGKILKESNPLAWRIEHAQCVDKSDLPLFKKFSIFPSVQPTHLVDDYKMAIEKLDSTQLRNSYRLKSLMEQNGIIILGTDYPVASLNPIETFYNAVYRIPNNLVSKNENLTREEALKGITFWIALANNEYETKGSLEVGKVADFVVLSRDIMKIPKEDVKKAEVEQTFVDGEIVYENRIEKK